MESADKSIHNVITPTYVLLPFYTEFSFDVFLDILKKVVARTKLGEEQLESAFISGMDTTTLFLESEDLTTNCTSESPKSKQIRLSKLMGFWTVNNFPLLGKKVLGELWQPPKDRKVVIGNDNGQTKDDKQMDSIIFNKFELRAIELSVNSSTLAKVKHFVSVPACVCEKNYIKISKKMRMFDVQDAHMESCWQALKSGKYLTSDGFEVSFIFIFRQINFVYTKIKL